MFGYQIAKEGKIIDYSSANSLVPDKVVTIDSGWENWEKIFKPLYQEHTYKVNFYLDNLFISKILVKTFY